jgi:hypothetical protein
VRARTGGGPDTVSVQHAVVAASGVVTWCPRRCRRDGRSLAGVRFAEWIALVGAPGIDSDAGDSASAGGASGARRAGDLSNLQWSRFNVRAAPLHFRRAKVLALRSCRCRKDSGRASTNEDPWTCSGARFHEHCLLARL